MAICSRDINRAASVSLSTAQIAKGLTKLGKRNSIMKMAEPGIYQYPLMTSNAIEIDVNVAIARALQITFASAVTTAYSLNPVMYLKDYNEPSDFVKRFHTNKSVPVNFAAAGNALGIESATTVDANSMLESISDADLTGAQIDTNVAASALEALAISTWEDVTEQLDTSSLNDVYRPYDRTSRILNEKLESLKIANEDFASAFTNIRNTADDINQTVNNANSQSNIGLNRSYSENNREERHQESERIDPRTGQVTEIRYTTPKSRSHDVKVGETRERQFKNAVVRNDKMEALEPTMVNVQIVCHGDGKNGVGPTQFTQNLTLGIKVMPRVVQTNVLIASMVEASKNSHNIFKFLKWTKGEQNTLKFVLGIDEAKKNAIQDNAKIEVRTLKQSKKRKKSSNIFTRFLKNDTFPTLSIVITSYEAMKIREITGVNLEDLKNALKLMNEYFLLSFGIYDTEQNTLKILFDSDDDWGYTSVGAMKSMMNKTTDILNQSEVLKLFGRR